VINERTLTIVRRSPFKMSALTIAESVGLLVSNLPRML